MTQKEDTAKEILIVEDSETQVELLRRSLTGNGYKVSIARNGAEGLASAREHRPDLIISDIMMPVMDGYQFCRELKDSETLRDIPLMLLTQLSEPEEVIKGLEAGADNYLTKPFEEDFLLIKIKSLLTSPIRFTNNPKEKCIEFSIDQKRYTVRSSRGQTLNFLLSTYENVVRRNLELYRMQEELERTNEQLEEKVKQRTATLAGEIAERKQLEVDLRKRNRELSALYAIYKSSTEKPLLREMVKAALDTIKDVLEIDTGAVYLLGPDKGTLSLYASIGLSEAEVAPFKTLNLGEGVSGKAAAEMRLVAMDAGKYPTKRLVGPLAALGLQSMVGVPIISGEELVGSMGFGYKRPHLLSKDELELLSVIGRHTGALVRNARLFEKLKESEERFRLIVDNAPFILGIVDSKERITFLNKKFQAFFGFAPEDIPTIADWKVKAYPDEGYRERAFAQWYEDIRRVVGGELPAAPVRIYRVTCADGSVRHVEITFSIVGELMYVVFNDVTERINTEEELARKNAELENALNEFKKAQTMLIRSEKLAALGQLSAGVAHEIKNPLNIISTSVQLLMMEENVPEEALTAYKGIMAQIARAVKITENLRNFARDRKPDTVEVDIHEFIEKTISLVEYEMKLDNINFVKNFHPSPIVVKGDRDQLAQVFLNLINNGADSMKEKQRKMGWETLREAGWKGDLAIRTSHDDEWAYISFSDKGIGMPKEVRQRVFDPFFTTKAEGKGTGLGLSIAAGIIENHGGAILLESVEGDGCTFTVKLPYNKSGMPMI